MENERKTIIDYGNDYNNDKHCDLDGYFVDKEGHHKPILLTIKNDNQKLIANRYNEFKMENKLIANGFFSGQQINACIQYSLNNEFIDLSSPKLNSNLRNGYTLTPDQKKMIKQLDKATNLFIIKEPITVYRGISIFDFYPKEITYLQKGSIYSNNGFLSTSYNQVDAAHYAILDGAVISIFCEIKVNPGQKCLPLTQKNNLTYLDENEILFGRNKKLKVLNRYEKQYNKIKFIKYEMEMLNDY